MNFRAECVHGELVAQTSGPDDMERTLLIVDCPPRCLGLPDVPSVFVPESERADD